MDAVSSIKMQIPVETKTKSIETLRKYVNNEQLKDIPDTFTSSLKGAVGSTAVFEGIPLFNLLRRNKKLNGKIINKGMEKIGEANINAGKALLKGEGKLSSRIMDYLISLNDSQKALGNVKSAVKTAAKKAKLETKLANTSSKRVAKKITKKLGKLGTEKVAEKTAGEAAIKTVSKFGKFGKFMKSTGAGIMLAFSGIFEMVGEVIPTFKELGNEKGMKQLGKSTVKVVGDTVGFIGGQQAGLALGTAIGTAICPGIGTGVGAVVGFIGGMLGSFAMGKVTKAVVGDSEREIAKKEQLQQESKQIANDDEAIETLKNEVIEKINLDLADDGELTEDSQIAMEVLENLENNPFAEQTAA